MLRLFVLICAAVMSFIMRSDATRAAPIMTQQRIVLTRLHPTYTPQSPFSVGLPSTETSRGTLSITDRRANPQRSFSYSQSSPDTTQYRAMNVQRGHSAGGTRPEQKENEHSYYSYSGIIRKSSPKISSSQIWQHQKSPNERGVPRSDSPNEDKSFYSSQTAGHWKTPLTPRASYKETNQLPAMVPWSTSRGIQSGTFLNPPTSISNRAEVIYRNPEKTTPSITDFSQRPQKEGRSYLFKDSQTSESGLSNVATVTHEQRLNSVHHVFPGQTQNVNKYQPVLKHPAPVQGKKIEDSALKSDLTTKAPKPDNKPDQPTKSIFGFRGFKSPLRQTVTEPSSSKQRPTSRRYNFVKGKDYQFKIANKYPSSSPKYSFGQREAPAATTPSTVIQTVSTSTASFKERNDASTDRNTDHGSYRRLYGLKRFNTKPLGGTKAQKSAPLQKGFKLMNWQTQRPQNINTAGKREELKPLPKSAGSRESITILTPDEQTHKTHTEQHSITVSSSHKSAQGLKAAPTSELLNQTKLVSLRATLFNTSTSSTVRGRRVKVKHTTTTRAPTSNTGCTVAIVRLSKVPARVKAVTYADILGSASFSGVRATSQTPVADKENFPNITATTEQPDHGGKNTTRSPEDETEEFINMEGKSAEMKTSDLFLDNEGSGAFNMSGVSSTHGEELLELNYLRTSTGNVSFKSVQLSQTEKQ